MRARLVRMNAYAPIILGDRQEQFCQQFLAGKSQTEAYKIAYSAGQKVAEANASRLLRNARVVARIDQLRAQASAAQRVSLPFLSGLLIRAYEISERTNQGSAAAQAAMGLAKLHGFLIDRQQTELLIRKPSAEPLSPDEMSETEWLSQHGLNTIEHNPEPQGSKVLERGIEKGIDDQGS